MSVSQSEKVDLLAAALCKAQQQVEGAKKDSENPFFRSKYADLASVWLACRDALTGNGLAIAQFPGYQDGAALVTTVLLHESGQWMAATAGAPLVGKTTKDGTMLPADAQSVGSAITYLRRYALAAVAGVVQEDDDGNAATQKRSAGRGQPVPRGAVPKEPVSPPPSAQPLTARPAALTAPESAMPWERPDGVTEDGEVTGPTRDMPCPFVPSKRAVKDLAKNQLAFLEDFLTASKEDEAAVWLPLVIAERAARSKTT